MDRKVLHVVSHALPMIQWTCRCAHRRFVCSERFRVNTNGKLADIWLVYRCERCDATKNVTVVERTPVSRIPPALFDAATGNDPVAARALSRDVAMLRRSGIRVGHGDRWAIIDDASAELSPDGRREASASLLLLVLPEPLLVRLDAVIAAGTGLRSRDVRCGVGAGRVTLEPPGRVDRMRLWTTVAVQLVAQ